jgi:hypothetical protein
MRDTGKQDIHCYVVATHRILCGVTERARSTKHAHAVTCPACRELLLAAGRGVAAAAGPVDAVHGP